ncbi:MAG: hypothetical protein ABI870_04950 [Rhodanobacter sp.]
MSEHGLTPDELKLQHAAEIAKVDTFKTHGVSSQAASEYLISPEGGRYLDLLTQADPNAPTSDIEKRAIQQITSGRELPRMELSGEPLVKIVPSGASVSPYSPFFARHSALEEAAASGKNLSEYFALPISSEAPRYDVYQIKPHAPTEVFVNEVAPTSELGGKVIKAGGAEQYLVPHRGLYAAPTYVKSVDNSVVLQAERGVGAGLTPGMAAKGLGVVGAVAVAYDVTTTAHHASALIHAGNQVGGQSEVLHFGSRNVGMLAGAELGATTGAALGVESGPGLLLTGAIGGVAGAIGGEKIATAIDNHRIYNQDDKAGNAWHLDPKHSAQGWTRTVTTNEIEPDGMPNFATGMPTYKTQTFTADATLSNELNYKASNTAVQLAMAHASSPKDPIPSHREPATHTACVTHPGRATRKPRPGRVMSPIRCWNTASSARTTRPPIPRVWRNSIRPLKEPLRTTWPFHRMASRNGMRRPTGNTAGANWAPCQRR